MLWIGLAHVVPAEETTYLGAYVNVVGPAESRAEFEKGVALEAERSGFVLESIEDVETLEDRFAHASVHKGLVELARQAEREDEVRFDTFHTYASLDKDEDDEAAKSEAAHMAAGLRRVLFDFPQRGGSDWQGVGSEGLWAERVGGKVWRLLNSPWYAYGVSHGDEVEVDEDSNGELTFVRVFQPSGHSTYRVFLADGQSVTSPAFSDAFAGLEALGCTYESEDGRLLSVDVPPPADISSVCRGLEHGVERGVWDFEEGHCSHARP
jgi:hypothetical protein